MVFLKKSHMCWLLLALVESKGNLACQGWEAGGVRMLHGSTGRRDTFFLLALLYFDLPYLLNVHKSGKDLQVLYFVCAVYQSRPH